jgi:gas vesicle protein
LRGRSSGFAGTGGTESGRSREGVAVRFLAGLMVGALVGAAAGLVWSALNGPEKRDGAGDEGSESQPREPVAEILVEAKARLEEGRRAFQEGTADARQRLTEQLARARGSGPSPQ